MLPVTQVLEFLGEPEIQRDIMQWLCTVPTGGVFVTPDDGVAYQCICKGGAAVRVPSVSWVGRDGDVIDNTCEGYQYV